MAKKNLKKNREGYGYRYTDIAQIHIYLEAEGWTYWQYTERIEGEDYIMTVPVKDGNEYPPRRGCRIIQGSLLSKSNAAQELGAAITYARRYSLLMAFGLATEDDDAECMTRIGKATGTRSAKAPAEPKPDKPKKAPEPTGLVTEAMISTMKKALVEAGASEAYALKAAKVERYEEISVEQFKQIMNKCAAAKAEKEAK